VHKRERERERGWSKKRKKSCIEERINENKKGLEEGKMRRWKLIDFFH
jgi:hypothetical protein